MKRSYVIKKITLITYNGAEIVLDIIDNEIRSKPMKILKENILDVFSTMEDSPVKVNVEVKYV